MGRPENQCSVSSTHVQYRKTWRNNESRGQGRQSQTKMIGQRGNRSQYVLYKRRIR